MGELKRGGDTSDNNALQLSLPHANSRQVVVSISQSQMGQLKIGRNRFSEGILGMIESDETEKKGIGKKKDVFAFFIYMDSFIHYFQIQPVHHCSAITQFIVKFKRN